MVPDLGEQAAFLRAALWLGLVRGQEVVAWAEARLLAAPGAPAGLAALAAVPAHDVTALRHALLDLGPEHPPARVVEAVFGRVFRQWHAGHRTVIDTCTVLTQARQWLPVPPATADAIRALELARHDVEAERGLPDLEGRLGTLLGSFADADAAFIPR